MLRPCQKRKAPSATYRASTEVPTGVALLPSPTPDTSKPFVTSLANLSAPRAFPSPPLAYPQDSGTLEFTQALFRVSRVNLVLPSAGGPGGCEAPLCLGQACKAGSRAWPWGNKEKGLSCPVMAKEPGLRELWAGTGLGSQGREDFSSGCFLQPATLPLFHCQASAASGRSWAAAVTRTLRQRPCFTSSPAWLLVLSLIFPHLSQLGENSVLMRQARSSPKKTHPPTTGSGLVLGQPGTVG
jgi:hypothetical protein